MADQIGAAIESLEHPLDLREQRAVVGVGAQEAERLVEAQDVRGARETRPRERRQQLPLAAGHAAAVQGARPFQIGDQPGWARAPTPAGARPGWRADHGISSDWSRKAPPSPIQPTCCRRKAIVRSRASRWLGSWKLSRSSQLKPWPAG